MNCPKCSTSIDDQNINISADIAKCSYCKNIFKISEHIKNKPISLQQIEKPSGTWLHRDFNTTIIGASTRSPIAFFLVPFMLIWSGGSIGNLYGSQILSGTFELEKSLLGIPFLLGSIFFWSIALMAIFVKVEIRCTKYGGEIFQGIASIGIKKTFKWKDISEIKEKGSQFYYPGGKQNKISLEGHKRISFGSNLNEDRRYFIKKSLEALKYKADIKNAA